MACFLVPTAEAIVTGVVSKVEKKNEVVAEGQDPILPQAQVAQKYALGRRSAAGV